MHQTRRYTLVLLMLLLCALPWLFNQLGVDFSSRQLALSPLDTDGKLSTDKMFYLMSGAIHHTLLEWSAVIVACIAAAISFLHYRLRGDVTVPIIGMALFCAGMLDTFHTLAATRIIQANAPNTDFIPFTWAISRLFNASIMIIGACINLWLFRQFTQLASGEKWREHSLSILVITGAAFALLSYFIISSAAQSDSLPQTLYPNTLISRPFDIFPLALFILGGTLFWLWYRQENSPFRLALLLSIFPEITTQLHMAFGSESLFDNHFNIAHGMKIIAYGSILVGLLLDLFLHAPKVNEALDSPNNKISDVPTSHQDELPVGQAARPLLIKVPVAIFALALTVALMVNFSFHQESERLIHKQQAEELGIESVLLEPLFAQLYRESASDILFLSHTPPIQNIIRSVEQDNPNLQQIWNQRLETIFSSMLRSKPYYTKLNYIRFNHETTTLTNVQKNQDGIFVDANKDAPASDEFLSQAQTYANGTAFFSAQNQQPGTSLDVTTPIYDQVTQQFFGVLILTFDFNSYIRDLTESSLKGLDLYLADQNNQLLYFPQGDHLNGVNLFDLFPDLQTQVQLNPKQDIFLPLADVHGHIATSYFHHIDLQQYGSQYSLKISLRHKGDTIGQKLADFRKRSALLGISLAIIALVLSIFAARQMIQPLLQMIEGIKHYEKKRELPNFPTDSRDEIGVLARSFHNVILRVNQAIEKQKQSASELKESTEYLHAVVNTAADAIITINEQGQIQSFNAAAEHMFGYQQQEVLHKNVAMLMPFSHGKQHDSYILKYMESGQSGIIGKGRELEAICKDGSSFPIHLAISEVFTQRGRIFTGIIRDITVNKQAEQALIQAKEAAESTAQMKSEFLASMSHEIRTPMNGVLGMLGLLLHSRLDKEQHHHASLARSSAESLLSIINDILDFSKIEAGKLELEIIEFNLRSQLGELIEAISPKAQEKGIELILDVTEVNESIVKGDPGRLRQVLTNLIGNAIKFTHKGEIIVKIQLHESGSQDLTLKASVQDTGIGIPTQKLSTLFDSFTQVDASTTRQYGGTGLGLAIVKQLCELMHGRITVSSEENKGSCFSFEIMLQKSQQSQPVLPQISIQGVPMLIVDDNDTNREVLKGQLKLWGAEVTEASDAREAIAALKNRLKSDRAEFKVAFLDMQMPGMDGLELGKAIRAKVEYQSIKLIMMTSMARRGDAKLFAEVGFDAYFPKPTTTSDLFDALSIVLVGGETLEQASPLITHHYLKSVKELSLSQMSWPEQTRLLLVEDNYINQTVALNILERSGLNCDIANNGLEALEALQQAQNEDFYHLIMMDCQMPEMDGYQATANIRDGAAGDIYKDIPIVAMTANAMKGDREKCLQAGMDDYLSKPINANELIEKLQHWLDQRSRQPLS